jgi:hypothetical protein
MILMPGPIPILFAIMALLLSAALVDFHLIRDECVKLLPIQSKGLNLFADRREFRKMREPFRLKLVTKITSTSARSVAVFPWREFPRYRGEQS